MIAVVGLITLWELDVWCERSLYFMSLCNHYQSWLMQKESGVGICLIGEKYSSGRNEAICSGIQLTSAYELQEFCCYCSHSVLLIRFMEQKGCRKMV
jgi:hypothetical protein